MSISISTEDVAPGEREAFWVATLAQLFGGAFAVSAPGGMPLNMAIRLLRLGALSVAETVGNAASFDERGRDGSVAVAAYVLREGAATLRNGDAGASLGTGDMVLVDLRRDTGIVFEGEFRLCTLVVPMRRLAEVFPQWQDFCGRALHTTCGPAAVMQDIVQSAFHHCATLSPADRGALGLALAGMLGTVLAANIDPAGNERSRMENFHIERVKAHVREHLQDPALSIAAIAAAVGLSPSYIHKLFAREPMRLMQWIAAERLDACYRELACRSGQRRPIYQVAGSWGFDDQAHFSRAFRGRFGITPREAREGQPPCMKDGGASCCEYAESISGVVPAKSCFRSRC